MTQRKERAIRQIIMRMRRTRTRSRRKRKREGRRRKEEVQKEGGEAPETDKTKEENRREEISEFMVQIDGPDAFQIQEPPHA
jgi:hypothetical protein